jgi:hypothetical protein
MPTRDEDIVSKRLYRPVQLYRVCGGADAVPWDKAAVIVEMVDRSPAAWTPRLIWEELQEAGHREIPEDLVAAVIAAM